MLCGPDPTFYEKDSCPESIYTHFSNSQALITMLYIMTNNPIIAYSPKGTEADAVVKRVRNDF